MFAVTTLPRSTRRCPARPSMGARISVYASCKRALSTIASLARTVARAFSTAAWPATTAARACARLASAAAMAALPFSIIAWSARRVAAAVSIAVRTWSALLAGDVPLPEQLRVAPILSLGVLELRLVAHDVGLGLGELRPGLGERRLRLRDRRLVARRVGLGLARLRLVARHVGLGLLDGRLDRARVDGEQEVALLEIGAVREMDLDDAPRDLRLDGDHLVGHGLAHRVEVERRVARDRGRHGDRRRRALEGGLRLLLAGGQGQGEKTDPDQRSGPAARTTIDGTRFIAIPVARSGRITT